LVPVEILESANLTSTWWYLQDNLSLGASNWNVYNFDFVNNDLNMIVK
jgi:hypothetical protein